MNFSYYLIYSPVANIHIFISILPTVTTDKRFDKRNPIKTEHVLILNDRREIRQRQQLQITRAKRHFFC